MPSSKYARRYHSPSQASRSSAGFSAATYSRQRSARLPLAPRLGQRRPFGQHRVQEPRRARRSRPCPGRPPRFIPSFQSPVPIRGRPWAPVVRLRSSARAQCSKSALRSAETRGSKYDSSCPAARPGPSRNGTTSSSTAPSPRDVDVAGDDVGQPEQVVGDPRAHAAPAGRVPPVLDVALDELPGRGAQQVLARQPGRGDHQRQHVLQLIAESVGAAGLIEGRARPHATRERLVQQPAVEHDVHRAIRRPDLHGAEHLRPSARRSIAGRRPHPARDSEGSARAPARRSPPRRGRTRRRRGRRRADPPSSAARRRDRGRRRPAPRAAAGARAPPADPARRCGRGTPSGRPSTPCAGR